MHPERQIMTSLFTENMTLLLTDHKYTITLVFELIKLKLVIGISYATHRKPRYFIVVSDASIVFQIVQTSLYSDCSVYILIYLT